MFKTLWTKLLFFFLLLSFLSLTAAVIFRFMLVNDFDQYRQGELLDRVQWLTATIEGIYEKSSGWNRADVAHSAIGALMLGLDITVTDQHGSLVITSHQAMDMLSENMRRRVEGSLASQRFGETTRTMDFPLFAGGEEIGAVDVAFMERQKDLFFIEEADRFLSISLVMTAIVMVVVSLGLAKGLVRPINDLAEATRSISRGEGYRHVTSSGRDEIAALSDAFNHMAEALDRQERLRKKLISDVAHELRTPISAMRGEIEAMLDGIIETEESALKSLLEETQRLASLIEGIEDLSHAEAGALTVKREEILLRPFIQHIVDRFTPLFAGAGVILELECPESAIIFADPEKLSRILLNLVSNALQATRPGDRVRITARRQNGTTILDVVDSGQGIAPESLPHIFERFFTTGSGRLGLGLAIVKELVAAHDGRISVKSELDRGTTFSVLIPAVHNLS